MKTLLLDFNIYLFQQKVRTLLYKYIGCFIRAGIIIYFPILLISSFPNSALAGHEGGAFSIKFENDMFGGTDENYTNGISMALTDEGRGGIAGIWDIAGISNVKLFTTYELTQLQFTPSNLNRVDPDPNDRPYAALLYAGVTTHLQKGDNLHSLKLIAGIVGPLALGEETQNAVHKVIRDKLPAGWGYQLKNEPVLNLLYEYRHRTTFVQSADKVGIDMLPKVGMQLGNYMIQADAVVQFRIGRYMQDDFGISNLRGIGYLPPPRIDMGDYLFGWFMYAGAGASAVARNLPLDGNTFANSRSVKHRPVIPMAEIGISLLSRQMQMSFSYYLWGKEFYGQHANEGYGSLQVSYLF